MGIEEVFEGEEREGSRSPTTRSALPLFPWFTVMPSKVATKVFSLRNSTKVPLYLSLDKLQKRFVQD